MEWFEILNILEKIANIILPICVLVISYVASQEQISIWRGIKTVDCKFLFSKKGFPDPSAPPPFGL